MKTFLKRTFPSLFGRLYAMKEAVRLGLRRQWQLRKDRQRDFARDADMVGPDLATRLIRERRRRNVNRLGNLASTETPRTGRALHSVRIKGLPHPVHYRDNVSDLAVLEQIFYYKEYAALEPDPDASLIIDAGANIGCATLVFLQLYPNARIVAIEPDSANFKVLQKNVAPYGDRVKLINSGVWSSSAPMKVERGESKLAWEIQVRPCRSGEERDFVAVSIGDVLDAEPVPRADWLKLDVEGTEKELFSRGCDAWLPRVRNIIIELHGRECRDTFFGALERYSYELSESGEYHLCRNLRSRHDAVPDRAAVARNGTANPVAATRSMAP